MSSTSSRLVRAVLRRDWEIERTYHLRMLLHFTSIAGVALGLYFISRLVDPETLSAYGGNYFDFAVVGLAVTSFAGVGLGGFSDAVMREQSTGTIELLLASPAPPLTTLASMFVFPLLVSALQVALLLVFGIGVVGSGIPLGGLLLSIPVLALTTATFAAFGLASAGLLLLAKRGDPISGPFYQLSMLLSGAVFPLDVLPGFIEAISIAVPATWGVQATRELLLNDAGWRDVLPETLVLAGFSVVLLPLGAAVLARCLRTARAAGVLGSY